MGIRKPKIYRVSAVDGGDVYVDLCVTTSRAHAAAFARKYVDDLAEWKLRYSTLYPQQLDSWWDEHDRQAEFLQEHDLPWWYFAVGLVLTVWDESQNSWEDITEEALNGASKREERGTEPVWSEDTEGTHVADQRSDRLHGPQASDGCADAPRPVGERRPAEGAITQGVPGRDPHDTGPEDQEPTA